MEGVLEGILAETTVLIPQRMRRSACLARPGWIPENKAMIYFPLDFRKQFRPTYTCLCRIMPTQPKLLVLEMLQLNISDDG